MPRSPIGHPAKRRLYCLANEMIGAAPAPSIPPSTILSCAIGSAGVLHRFGPSNIDYDLLLDVGSVATAYQAARHG